MIVMSLSCGKTNVIGLLIDHSDGVNVKDKHGDRTLIFAAQRVGDVVVVVCLLLANGTDANEQNDFGLSALAIPVSSSSVSAAVTILDPSADALAGFLFPHDLPTVGLDLGCLRFLADS